MCQGIRKRGRGEEERDSKLEFKAFFQLSLSLSLSLSFFPPLLFWAYYRCLSLHFSLSVICGKRVGGERGGEKGGLEAVEGEQQFEWTRWEVSNADINHLGAFLFYKFLSQAPLGLCGGEGVGYRGFPSFWSFRLAYYRIPIFLVQFLPALSLSLSLSFSSFSFPPFPSLFFSTALT